MDSIEIEVFPNRFGQRRWQLVEGGPFPVTKAVIDEARKQLEADRRRRAAGGHLDWMHAGPTIARELLKTLCPELSDFDRLLLGYVVTAEKYRIKGE